MGNKLSMDGMDGIEGIEEIEGIQGMEAIGKSADSEVGIVQ